MNAGLDDTLKCMPSPFVYVMTLFHFVRLCSNLVQ